MSRPEDEEAAVRSAMEFLLPEIYPPSDEDLYAGLDEKQTAYMKARLAENPLAVRTFISTARMRAERPVRSPKASSEWVYFIQSGLDGPIKIGCARSVQARLKQLQIGNAEPLHLLAAIRGDAADERQLHQRFGAHWIRGEWFAPAEELAQFIDGIR